MKIVITGARGQLGQDLARALARYGPTALARDALDVTDEASVDARIRELRPDVVLNTAAYNHVDRAENEPERAFAVNALAARNLARRCAATGALLVHFSTDYVFGEGAPTPRVEHDRPSPRGVYAVSKLAGEELLRSVAPLHLIIRTSGLYGLHGRGGKGTNFVETMLRLGAGAKKVRVVRDQVLTPTYSADLAAKVAELVARWERDRAEELLGLYHITNDGSTSWHEFATEIFRHENARIEVEPVSTAEYGAPAPRPPYSVLSPGHLRRIGVEPLRHWRDAVADYLTRRKTGSDPILRENGV